MAMEIDFGAVEDAEDFSPVPDGKYHVRVVEIEEKVTRNGDPMWNLTLEVQEGPYAGRTIWDSLTFTAAALKRVKLVLSRLGVDVSGKVKLDPSLIMDREAIVEAVVEEYQKSDGGTGKKSKVPFAGYEKYSAEAMAALAKPGAGANGGAAVAGAGAGPAVSQGPITTRTKPAF